MARTQARILVSIWNDADFLALPPLPQRMYLFLLSQPNLSHAGLLPLTIKRWARSSGILTMDQVREQLTVLQDADYVVIDGDTEELLIRTLVRNDGVWKQPKVMLAMKADAAEIVSPKLRYRLRAELLKIDTTSLKPETRSGIESTLAEVIATLPDTGPQGYPIPEATGIGYPHAGAGAPSSASTTASTTSPVPIAPDKPTRQPDEVWDALLDACHVDPTSITSSSRGAYNRAVADLKAVGATPAEIRRRAAVFRGQWRDMSLTPTALARRWAECDRTPAPLTLAPSRNDQILDRAMKRAEAAEAQQRKALP